MIWEPPTCVYCQRPLVHIKDNLWDCPAGGQRFRLDYDDGTPIVPPATNEVFHPTKEGA